MKNIGGKKDIWKEAPTEGGLLEKGIAAVGLETGKPVLFGVLTCEVLNRLWREPAQRQVIKAGMPPWGRLRWWI